MTTSCATVQARGPSDDNRIAGRHRGLNFELVFVQQLLSRARAQQIADGAMAYLHAALGASAAA